ncbi:MAG: hypothetical protein RLZZ366_1698 [Pseudomonadota bacterium]|jgi:aldose 1-epimerase
MLQLTCGDSLCTLYPRLGGSLGCWTVDGQEMLRVGSAEAIEACDPLGMASFPLVPYSNRIGGAQFEWRGETITLRPNFAPELHAIHGVGWKACWSVSEYSESEATLTYAHVGDDNWPWPFEARQRVSLTENRLTLALSIRNLAAFPVPASFGHHPYFDADGAMLTFNAEHVWMSGNDGLPTEPVVPTGQFDFATVKPVEGRVVDHCYAGVSGEARISWVGRSLALEIIASPPLKAAVVYVPKGGDAFCFEPVAHINNALKLPGHEPSMPVIPAGETLETTITFKATALRLS